MKVSALFLYTSARKCSTRFIKEPRKTASYILTAFKLSVAHVPDQLSNICTDFFQPTRSQMSISCAGLWRLMPQQMLNIIECGITTIDQNRCEAMPQIMNSEVVSNPGSFLDPSKCLLRMSDRSTGCIPGKDIGVLGLLKSSLIIYDFLS